MVRGKKPDKSTALRRSVSRNIEMDMARLLTVPGSGTSEFQVWASQSDFFEFLRSNAEGDEIVVYIGGLGTFLAPVLIPLKEVETLNKEDLGGWSWNPYSSWGLSYRLSSSKRGLPRLWITMPLEDSGSRTLAKGFQILFLRSFDGRQLDTNYFELHPEFSHAHGLHYVAERQAYCRFNDMGDLEDVTRRISVDTGHGKPATVITMRRDVLDLHLAATRRSLVLLFDSSRLHTEDYSMNVTARRDASLPDESIYCHMGVMEAGGSYLRGFHVVDVRSSRTAIRKSLVPKKEKKEYESFMAWDWKNKRIRNISCDPVSLANYFQPGDPRPFETTPAFFKPEVLLKYKSDPKKYRLTERTINCRNSWYLKTYDINEAGQVHTYLIYLGQLPHEEQLHWRQYNERPKKGLSKRAIKTDFEAEWDDSLDPLPEIKERLTELEKAKSPWWTLRNPELIETTHYPVTTSEKEWADEILGLDQLLIEGFEHAYLKRRLTRTGKEVDPKFQSLKLLELNLIGAGYEDVRAEEIVAPLKELHRIRSVVRAHASDDEVRKLKARLIREHRDLRQQYRDLIRRCLESLMELVDASNHGHL